MNIPNPAYKYFLEKVRGLFDSELNDTQREELKDKKFKYWHTQDANKKPILFTIDVGTGDCRHFYLATKNLEERPFGYTLELDNVVIKVLEKIGYTIPDGIEYRNKAVRERDNDAVKARILFYLFILKTDDQLLDTYPELDCDYLINPINKRKQETPVSDTAAIVDELSDKDQEKVTVEPQISEIEKTTSIDVDYQPDNDEDVADFKPATIDKPALEIPKFSKPVSMFQGPTIKPAIDHKQRVLNYLTKYLAELNEQKFVSAFDMWHPQYKKTKWSNSIEKFMNSAENQKTISAIQIWDINIIEPTPGIKIIWNRERMALCKLYFEQNVSYPFSDELNVIKSARVRDLKAYNAAISVLKNKIGEVSKFPFENLHMDSLPYIFDIIGNELGGNLYKVFPSSETQSIKRLYDVELIPVGANWKIKAFKPVFTHLQAQFYRL